jgi:hypothetical protein
VHGGDDVPKVRVTGDRVELQKASFINVGEGMELAAVEARLGLTFPEQHRRALLGPSDPIHEACDFLLPSSPYEGLRLVEVNELLHDPSRWDRWPAFLVAFASNGCGDYFAYDLRRQPPDIVYIDPDRTIEENLGAENKLVFSSFEAWYQQRRTRRGSEPGPPG